MFFCSIANGDPPLNVGLNLEDSVSLPPFAASLPNLSLPNALFWVFLSVDFSLGLPNGTFSLYPSGTLLGSDWVLPKPYNEAKSCGVP